MNGRLKKDQLESMKFAINCAEGAVAEGAVAEGVVAPRSAAAAAAWRTGRRAGGVRDEAKALS